MFVRFASLKRILRYIKLRLGLVILSLILTAVSVGVTLYVPIIIGDGIDMIISKGQVDINGVISKLVLIAILTLVTVVLQWLIGVINNRVTYSVVKQIRCEAFEKIQHLPVSYIDTHGHGSTVSRVITDVDVFSDGLLMGFTQLFSGLLTIAGTLVFMLLLDIKIALLVVVLTPASIFISKFIATKTFRLFREQAQAKEDQTSLVEEVISEQKTVKAFSVESRMIERFEETNEKLKKASLGAVFYSSLVNPSTRFVNGVIYAAVALVGALAVGGGVMTVGMLTCFLGYANQYTKPFNEISGVITEFQNALTCAERIFELIDTPSEVSSNEVTKLPDTVDGKISLESVDFSYSPDKPLINDLSVDVNPGQMVAIVGPTGCGKTTLINLLMRFYDVCDGAVKVDGTDIREITRHDLRRNYGVVLQETWLKNGTVADNIRLGRPNATDDEVISAAKTVHAHGFIKRLPKGYETVVGDGGVVLSEGQRQLISIARVMLCLPPMLILDEATSSIDLRTEVKIQAAFDRLTKGRTSFVVAHRLTTVKNADIILVMKDGSVVEAGTHSELLEKGGFYKSLYDSQFLHESDLP